MQTLDQSLAGLVRMKVVTPEEALAHSSHPDRLQKLVQFEYKAKKAIQSYSKRQSGAQRPN